MAATHTVFHGNQDSGLGRDSDFRQAGDDRDTAADDLGIHGPVTAQDEFAQFLRLVCGQEIGSLADQFRFDGIFHVRFADDGLFRGKTVRCQRFRLEDRRTALLRSACVRVKPGPLPGPEPIGRCEWE
jgi:hypothetical protein